MAGISVNVNKTFDSAAWTDFVQVAANQNPLEEKRFICRVIYPKGDNRYQLDLMSQSEVKRFLHTHGKWSSNCVKMRFSEVIRISRMCLACERDPLQKARLVKALNQMADKAEAKYNNGWCGTARKILSWISNLFSSNDVRLFVKGNDKPIDLYLPYQARFFVGTDAQFARHVANAYNQPVPYDWVD